MGRGMLVDGQDLVWACRSISATDGFDSIIWLDNQTDRTHNVQPHTIL
jgi:hypothetical protein